MSQLAKEIKTELALTDENYPLTILASGAVIIEVPATVSTFTARNLMQGLNTARWQARRTPRSLRQIEVTYRKVAK